MRQKVKRRRIGIENQRGFFLEQPLQCLTVKQEVGQLWILLENLVVLGGLSFGFAINLNRLCRGLGKDLVGFKIGLGLVQCLSTLRSFSRVLWPEVFADFIVAIDQFTVEVSLVSKRSHTQASHTSTRRRPSQPKPTTCSP